MCVVRWQRTTFALRWSLLTVHCKHQNCQQESCVASCSYHGWMSELGGAEEEGLKSTAGRRDDDAIASANSSQEGSQQWA